MTLRILADENIPRVRETFAHLGAVSCLPGRAIGNADCAGADILLVRSITTVDRALLAGTPVRFVGSATIGYDHIDADYLAARGIQWASAPGCNADSVVDYVISAVCRLEGALQQLLTGARVGIIGMGNVGSQLYRRLDRLGVQCVGYDPLIPQTRYPVLTDLDTVLDADVVCVHAPLTRSGAHPSYHLLDAARLAQLRPGATLISAGRGAVLDSEALLELLWERDDIGVVMDVWEHEPDIDMRLLQRVDLATPHIAGYSYDGKLAGTDMIYRACCRFLDVAPRERVRAPPVAQPLRIRGSDYLGTAVRDAVLAAYDIAADDQRFRGALLHHSESVTVRDEFDRLRRDYPQRREFSCYRIADADALPLQSRHFLAGLGFQVDPAGMADRDGDQDAVSNRDGRG